MRQSGAEALLDRWMNDATFRNEMRANPESAVQAAGLSLDAEEWAAVRAVDWSLSDEQLQARISKGTC